MMQPEVLQKGSLVIGDHKLSA